MRYKIKKKLKSIKFLMKLMSMYYWNRYPNSIVGSKQWLIGTEIKYSGENFGNKVRVKRKQISPLDPRQSNKPKTVYSTGGDRMLHHGYADLYSKYLKPFYGKGLFTPTICEFGILKGTGLAIWCDLFPKARCLGFDIDLSNINGNIDNLLKLGAFSRTRPELYEYDQFEYSAKFLEAILNGDKIDICIDDGCHMDEAILTTFNSVLPHLSDRFVYFIEDNSRVHKHVRDMFDDFTVHSRRQLTIVTL